MASPVFSVIIPAYNAGSYVREAISSILAQSFTDFECIILDDGSSDDTLSLLREMEARDSRLRIISRENRGLVTTLNELIGLSRGRYLARMDADDRAHPERLARQFEYLESHPDCVALGSIVTLIDPQGRTLKPYRLPTDHEGIVGELLEGNGGALVHPVVTLRASAVSQVGGYDSTFDYAEDWDLFLRLSEVGRLANLPDTLLDYRVHQKSYNQTRNLRQLEAYLIRVNGVRSTRGLPPLDSLQQQRAGADRASILNLWACWALEGRQPGTAKSLLLQSILSRPFRRETWKLLKYSLLHPPRATL